MGESHTHTQTHTQSIHLSFTEGAFLSLSLLEENQVEKGSGPFSSRRKGRAERTIHVGWVGFSLVIFKSRGLILFSFNSTNTTTSSFLLKLSFPLKRQTKNDKKAESFPTKQCRVWDKRRMVLIEGKKRQRIMEKPIPLPTLRQLRRRKRPVGRQPSLAKSFFEICYLRVWKARN